ncbi:MAG: polyprenyl synthetase family protein [Planctomycetes bacterium]|nr:polyprenyl synthetase family protein [Planctomycetota bacterium]
MLPDRREPRIRARPAIPVDAFLSEAVRLADAALECALPRADAWPARLHQAMRHSVFAGGKRLRPALVLGACRACVGDDVLCAPAMAAIELLHTYTLVHDDLPAMDDDDLRRGRPTCHKAFDEATAILAGDALQALAFETVAALGADAVAVLARAGGSRGVVGGQQEDLDAEGAPVDASDACRARLERIHRGKTAAMIACACELGALSAGASPAERAALVRYGEAVGLAFQIADDVLDATASAAVLGKTPGKDAAQGKLTYVAVYGLERARSEALRLERDAVAALAPLGDGGEQLVALAHFVVGRDH